MFGVQLLFVVTLLFFKLHYYTTILHRVSTGVTPFNLGLKQLLIHRTRRDFELFIFKTSGEVFVAYSIKC